DYQMRVLIIEDSQVLRRLIETCFRDFDFQFEAQRLPHSPQRIGGFEQAKLVLIGMYQPFTIGLGIIQRLRMRQDPPAVIALTTDTREKSIAMILEAGADAVVKMPFRPDELRAAAVEALGQDPEKQTN
ncbi:MAG: response regulator, partial [Acidimicrobiia bacterium]|nr:response regulator [Acidimicrobiia bacterium]